MKVAISLLLIFCFFTAITQERGITTTIPDNEPDTIHWRANYKLKPEDFKGKPEMNSKYGAVTRAGINYTSKYNTDTSLVFTGYCVFYKKISWINPNELDSNLMEHEQGHFDIGEIFRRKLEVLLNSLGNCNYKKEKKYVDNSIENMVNQLVQERNKFDETYDKACGSPPNPTNQKVWTAKIQALLNN